MSSFLLKAHARACVGLLVLGGISACVTSEYQFAQLALNRKHEAERNAEGAKDPTLKAYWQGVSECSSGPSAGQRADAAEAEDRKCRDANATKQLASVRARIAQAGAPPERDAARRVEACIELHNAKLSVAPFESMDACVERFVFVEEEKAKRAAAIQGEYAAAEAAMTPTAWLDFLEKHPRDEHARELVEKVLVSAAMADADTQCQLDERLMKVYPSASDEIPLERRLVLVGPPGLRVRDLQKLRAAGVGPTIVLARIRASTEPYKNFDADELGALKKMGVSDEIVTAMIEVTAKLADRRKEDEERAALRAELDSLRKLIEEKKASGEKTSGVVVQTKDGPMDTLASCAKRLGAMKLCEQIPFPGSTLCKGTAESSFPCPEPE